MSDEDDDCSPCHVCGFRGGDRGESAEITRLRAELERVRESLTAAVQGEREAICRYADADDFRPDLPIDRKYPELGAWSRGVLAVTEYIRSRTSPAVDVMAVVREYVEAYDDYQETINFKKTCRNDESVTVAADRRIKAGLALRALVDGKGEAKDGGAR